MEVDMTRYTLKDNIFSAVLGVVLAVPFTLYAINNPTKPTKPTTINHVVRHEIVTIEETTVPKAIDTKMSEKSNDKKYLGRFKVTAYCPCSKCCGKEDGITATGTKVKQGRTIAVDPKIIPLGSKVEIDGHTYIAEDVGGAIKGNCIDLYFDSHDEANQWGVKYKEVYSIGG